MKHTKAGPKRVRGTDQSKHTDATMRKRAKWLRERFDLAFYRRPRSWRNNDKKETH